MSESKASLLARNQIAQLSQGSRTSIKSSYEPSSCRICLSTIIDPAALTCGHRFCERCLCQYWDERDKTDFIVCPLCRANTFKVDFAKKADNTSTEDFRRTFNPRDKLEISQPQAEVHSITGLWTRFSILMPIIYCLIKLLKGPIIGFYNFVRFKINLNV
ncbi:E3 ubiquitin-protein ligase RNF170 [Bombyx mori]|uniref:RING-type domain-containing protein n=1 Tax=Bombyx mori TaxID=7091 RepID=A0A8R2R0Q0_BOMMO|nr:E3 ubiquitin-protein ligase RNF170-like [Bombyx mori]